MPTYEYECPKGHSFEEFKAVKERATEECPLCGATAKLIMVPVHIDYLHAGADSGFPSLAAKWDRLQRDKASGKTWDSNNNRYGGEYERKRS